MAISPLPKLLVPREQAAEKITMQINRGRQIIDELSASKKGLGFNHAVVISIARKDAEKWGKFTTDLLKGLLDDFPVGKEFSSPEIFILGGDPTTELEKWVNFRLDQLDSILQRLPLFRSHEASARTESIPNIERTTNNTDIFIVHGQDTAAKEEVARFIERLGLRAIILHEQTNKGRTIIEKFEQHSQVGFAVVLLTPDDVGHANLESATPNPRARQNVVFELGFFIGTLGRSRVCALLRGNIEIPTDISGVLYTPMDSAGAWRLQLAREIKAVGIDLDLNRAI